MARESAAQKKAREDAEAQQTDALTEVGDVAPAPSGLDLSKFINPDAIPAADATEAVEVVNTIAVDEAANVVDSTAPADVVDAGVEGGEQAYVVIVDSIGLGPAQHVSRGDIIHLDESRAQRLLSFEAVRPA